MTVASSLPPTSSQRFVQAIVAGDAHALDEALSQGFDLNAIVECHAPSGSPGETFKYYPLYLAAVWRRPVVMERLLERGALFTGHEQDEAIGALTGASVGTDAARDAVAIVVTLLRAGCAFKGAMGEEYTRSVARRPRRARIDRELERLAPGQGWSVATLLALTDADRLNTQTSEGSRPGRPIRL